MCSAVFSNALRMLFKEQMVHFDYFKGLQLRSFFDEFNVNGYNGFVTKIQEQINSNKQTSNSK